VIDPPARPAREACETKAAAKKGCESVQRAADEATVSEVET
jgi:uncharacterized protein YegP (UPF0339 family)